MTISTFADAYIRRTKQISNNEAFMHRRRSRDSPEALLGDRSPERMRRHPAERVPGHFLDGPRRHTRDGPRRRTRDGPRRHTRDGPRRRTRDGPVGNARDGPVGNARDLSPGDSEGGARGLSRDRSPADKGEPSVWRDLLNLCIKIVAIAAISALITYFLYGFHRNADPDMAPMVKDGDLVMFYRLDKDYAIGDLLLLSFQGNLQVRRVVARAGDTVDFTKTNLVVNGAIQQEPGIYQQTGRYETGISFPLVVPEGQVFVLGDARENATDSRVYGPVDIDDTLGTVIAVIRRRNM